MSPEINKILNMNYFEDNQGCSPKLSPLLPRLNLRNMNFKANLPNFDENN